MHKRLTIMASSAVPLMLGLVSLAASTKTGPDPIRALQLRVQSKEAPLEFEPKFGYLKAILRELKIDPSSQTLVYSKSSLQAEFIGPKTPRAIYFNDHTYIGWIPDAPLIEVATVDPVYGVRFYSLPNKPISGPVFKIETSGCVPCHGGNRVIAQSSLTPESGYPRAFAPTLLVTNKTPMADRWGGWYVSGTHGSQRHLGNEFSVGDDDNYKTDVEKGANVTDLKRYFDTNQYLTPHSDIVALVVLEHQMDVQNILARTMRSVSTAVALKDTSEMGDSCEALVQAILCSREVAFTAPIRGTSNFASYYSSTAPKDSKGRSLSELDLQKRLFKYPCSPLVYSASFEALPEAGRQAIWKLVADVLTGKNQDRAYKHLSVVDRQNILEILRDTKPDFAAALKG